MGCARAPGNCLAAAPALKVNSKLGSPYDEVSYKSAPVRLTHPDHLATMAALYGLAAPPVATCRVLELGCGSGANLIPMAAVLPDAKFLGVDLAAIPIAQAQRLSRDLHLTNIELRQMDILAIDPSAGEFDYIIAHGVYSWVPPQVSDKILAICSEHLAPGGVAYVSYNVFPGCHLRAIMRGMLEYQTRAVRDPELKLRHAYALLNFLAASNPKVPALREELNSIRSLDPSVVFHDDLAPVNHPVYFHQFMEHAGAHGLQFLSEAEYYSMQPVGFDSETVRTLKLLGAGDRVQEQQYLDFLKCRRFRQTLLCRREARLDPSPAVGRVTQCGISCPARPASGEMELFADAAEEFRTDDGASMTTNNPFARAAIRFIAERWPLAVQFRDLLNGLEEMPGIAGKVESEAVADVLLKSYACGLLDLHLVPSRFTLEPGEKPRAFSVARLQAQSGSLVTTLRHTTVEVGDLRGRRLISLLDGSRGRAALLRDLQTPEDASPPGAEDLERNLTGLSRLALFEA
jgi:SAM-dependent methyltransferase